jgi:uncharacterized membrane protein
VPATNTSIYEKLYRPTEVADDNNDNGNNNTDVLILNINIINRIIIINNITSICFALLQETMPVGTLHLYLLLIVGGFHFRGCSCDLSLFSENSTISAAFQVIGSVLESVNLAHLIPSLLIKSDDPDQFLSTVIKF